MNINIRAKHDIDSPFITEYSKIQDIKESFIEYGLSGFDYNASDNDNVSAWLPGNNPEKVMFWLKKLQSNGKYFRFFFPELFFDNSIEANKLFSKKDIGMITHLLIKVQVHKSLLFNSGFKNQPDFWMNEPVLNRIPLAIWLMGAVTDVRFSFSELKHANIMVIILKHKHSPRLSIIELTISDEFFQNGNPAMADKFECTGSDGIICVNGIWEKNHYLPRLSVHRGSVEISERKYSKEFNQIFSNAAKDAKNIKKNSKDAYKLAFEYLEACSLLKQLS